MKKVKALSIILALLISLSLVSCGAKEEPVSQTTAQTTAQTTTAPVQTGVAQAVVDTVNGYFANMPADIYKIDQKKFIENVKAGDNSFILDIRQKDVYDKGHVKGAVNAPWGAGLADVLEKLPSDRPIMVYCYTGQTAGQTVAALNVAGFNAKSVNLGYDLGISKVEGVADVIETTPNEFPQVEPLNIASDVKAAVSEYFKGLANISDAMYKNYKISEDDAKKLLDAGDSSVVFLSVRSAEDYAKGHIKGALNIPFAKGMEQKFNTLPKDKKIIVYCYTGQTAAQTVAGLRLLGYDAVSMNGGIGTAANAPAGWGNKGYELVTE